MATTTRDRDTRTSRTDRASRSRSGGSTGGTSRARGSSRARDGDRGEPRVTAKNLRTEDRRFIDQNARELSPSTLRAKWIHSTDEHQDRPGQTLATREPGVIRAWAEARDARPATVGRHDGDRPRSLRFDFGPENRGGGLQPVDWDAWLGTFQRRKLVFLFQEQRRNGDDSNFFRLDSPAREEG